MKYVLTIKIDSLNDDARVVDDPARGDLAAVLHMTFRNLQEVSVECDRVNADGLALQYVSFNAEHISNITQCLTALGIPFDLKHVAGSLLRVSVLDMLDTGWMLVRQKNDNTLLCMAPTKPLPVAQVQSPVFALGFVNDGTNLWAEFDGTKSQEAALLRATLDAAGTKYEVQP